MKRKICVLLVVMILILNVLAISASAYSFTATMAASSQKVTSATEVTVTVKVSNLDVGDNGINSFSAYLSYDTDVFETLTDSSVDGLNGWIAAYAPGTGKITLQKSSFVKSDEEIMQISLKTKSGLADNTQGEVKLSQITASNSATEITASTVSTMITIGAGVAEPPTTQNPPTTNPPTTTIPINTAPTNVVPNNNTSITNRVVENKTVNNTSNEVENISNNDNIPYTGSESSALSKIIIGVILIALIAYIKIERMKDVK